ncbi:NAD-dependent epimerase/dehydratase family protein [Streptomyces iconiensis]|uniref:NAD(P)-dependent oxidoreductase n=1 Tax=Streptomyces iconiensis TaxID=1384038 RepID=A0ABT6ZZH2_9ACTN|nr:NAD(P)-dependent oxidoreductase [Streptomyces iconiensis]MDJ1134477.1 NAD(P)-dependent oxidoreductase [Streptomyces iconiensis]
MTTVVTGASGFIGRVLCRELVGAGHEVVALDRVPPEPLGGVAELTVDLLADDGRIDDALAEATTVFHLAARAGVRDPHPDSARLQHRDNVLATERLLSRVRHRTHVVFTSSSSVYGGCRGARASAEGDPLLPRGSYARSKVAAERLCRQRSAVCGRTTVVRPFTVVGEGQRDDMALRRWIHAAVADRPLTVFGSLHRTRDFTDVREVARALMALAERGVDDVVNVGTGSPRRLSEAVAAIAEVTGTRPEVEVVEARTDEVPHTRADITRLVHHTGVRPQLDLPSVIRRIAADVPTPGTRTTP